MRSLRETHREERGWYS
jgi:hypothetical protein